MGTQKKGVTELTRSKKAVFQVALLICGAAMLCYGAWRGEAEARRADHGLKCTDRAGAGRRRAGIAVEPRNADDLALPLVDAPRPEVRQVEVREQGRRPLDPAAETADHF